MQLTDNYTMTVTICGEARTLNLYTTAGQENYDGLRRIRSLLVRVHSKVDFVSSLASTGMATSN